MGLRCSLFGHAYGEAVTEREQDRRGEEEILTIREVRECTRCGARKLLSENTEVRHLESEEAGPAGQPDSAVDQPPSHSDKPVQKTTSDAEPEGVEDEGAEVLEEPTTADTEAVSDLVDEAETSAESSSEPPSPTDPPSETVSEADTQATDRDEKESDPSEGGVIIDGTEDESAATDDAESASERAPSDLPPETVEGDSPDENALDHASEVADSPESDADRSPKAGDSTIDSVPDRRSSERSTTEAANRSARPYGTDPTSGDPATVEESGEVVEESGEVVEESGEVVEESEEPVDATDETAESMFGTERAFESAGSTGGEDPGYQFDAGTPETNTSAPRQGPSGITSAGSIDVDSEPNPHQALKCPECGFTDAARSSLRAGDICPECHRGYLARRE